MAQTVGTATIKLAIDSTGVKAGMKTAQSEIESGASGLSNKLRIGGKAVAATIGGAIASSFTAAIGIASANMDGAISRMDTLNNFPKVMSNLNISQEESQAAIDKMADKLTGLPTTLDDAALAVQRFTSKNQDVAESTDMFLALNNALLAGGASTDIQTSALEQMSQAYAKGKPDMLEWRTIMTAMPAQLTQVAQAMGEVDADALGEKLRSGEISMDEFMQTMMKMNQESIDGFQSLEEQARNATSGLGTQIQTLKTSVVKVMADAFNGKDMTKSFDQLVERAQNVIPQIVQGIMRGTGALMNLIPQVFQSIMTTIVENWPEFVQQLIDLTLTLIQYLPLFLQNITQMILQLVAGVLQQMPTILKTIVTAVMQIAQMLVSPENLTLLMDAAFQLLFAIVERIPAICEALADAMPNIIETITAFLTDPATIMMLINAAVQLFMGLVTAVPRILGSLISAFGKLFRDLWNGVTNIFKSFGVNFGKGIGNAIINGLNNMLSFIENTINAPINIINGAIDVINNIPGVNISHVQTISIGRIPTLATGGVTTGPTGAIIGEAGKEAVIPLEQNTDWAKIMAQELDKQFEESENGRTINIYMTNQIDSKLDINEVSRELLTQIRRTI